MKRQSLVLRAMRDPQRRRPQIRLAAVVAGVIALGSVAVLTPQTPALSAATLQAATSSQEAAIASNGYWIAYTTAPANGQYRRPGYRLSGSDVFLIHAGGKPRLVAGRGNGEIWNVCPAFSPDGTMLAFGRQAPGGRTIRVVAVARHGAFVTPRTSLKVSGTTRAAPCPKWSSDSSRLAYLDANNKIIVRGLDGSIHRRKRGDPTITDFERNVGPLLAPTGALVARKSLDGASCELVVSRRNGSQKRIIDDYPCSYAIASWSPDGRKLLVMKDMDGFHFAMIAVSVNAPFATTP